MCYIHTVLFNPEKEWGSDTCYNTDGPWKHYANWNKSHTRGQIVSASTYLKYLEKANS